MVKVLIVMFGILIIISPLLFEDISFRSNSRETKHKLTQKIIHIEGMCCENCAKRARKALLSIDEVLVAEVSFVNKKAKVTLSQPIDNGVFMHALLREGFDTTCIENLNDQTKWSDTTTKSPTTSTKPSTTTHRYSLFPAYTEIYKAANRFSSAKAMAAFAILDNQMRQLQESCKAGETFTERVNKHYLPVLKEVVFGLAVAEKKNRHIQKRENLCLEGIQVFSSMIEKYLAKLEEPDILDDETSLKAMKDFAVITGDLSSPELEPFSISKKQ